MTSAYNTRYLSTLVLSTTIQEEEEEDFTNSAISRMTGQPAPARIQHLANIGRLSTEKSEEGTNARSPRTDVNRRLAQLASTAVANVASAATKFINRVFHNPKLLAARHQHCGADSQSIGARKAGTTAEPQLGLPATSRGQNRRRYYFSPQDLGNAMKNYTNTGCSPRCDSDKNYLHQSSRRVRDPTYQSQLKHRSGHLVALISDNDVQFALQALQLAAHVHDEVWAQSAASGGGGGGVSREALLEAASPMYGTAMTAARAIQHRALHSLVKQAVRRYVDPHRGSPDDVLQVILELLTGCGGAPAMMGHQTPPPQPVAAALAAGDSSGMTSRGFGGVAKGDEGFCVRISGRWSPQSERGSSEVGSSRSSPRSPYQCMSSGDSSVGGRSSTRSSLDSNGSESPRPLPAVVHS